MKALIISIVVYFILGICYAIDYFHHECENMVENDGVKIGEFFVMTIFVGLLWPLLIIVFAILDIRNER